MQHVFGQRAPVAIQTQRCDLGGQARSVDSPGDPLGIGQRDRTAPRRIARCQHHPQCHALAVQQTVGKSRFGFKRMAEGMAKIEQCASAAGLALVFGDDARFRRDARRDRMFGLGACEPDHRAARLFQPVEKGAIAEHAVFEHFGVAGAQFARGKRAERIEICQHQRWLVEGADEVLARSSVDRGLAPD